MHWTRRAPLLSATSRTDSCWIIGSDLLRAADELGDDPALGGRERAALGDLHHVVGAELLGLVVSGVLLTALDVLAVHRIAEATLHDHDHRLLGTARVVGVRNDA